MKKRITFLLDENDPLYQFLLSYSKEKFISLTDVIRLALHTLSNAKRKEEDNRFN